MAYNDLLPRDWSNDPRRNGRMIFPGVWVYPHAVPQRGQRIDDARIRELFESLLYSNQPTSHPDNK